MLRTTEPCHSLFNGRPISINQLSQTVPVIFECWYLGQETGTAVAEVLFGDTNPSGKLPVTLPRSVGQLPVYYNRKPTSFRNYNDSSRDPLFVFGHGLSYTTFALGGAKVEPAKIKPNGTATVTGEVSNTGAKAGDEVVQLYVRDVEASVKRPKKQLMAFERISLRPGESRTVSFTVSPDRLAFWDEKRKAWVLEPGAFEVMVGSSSADLRLKGEIKASTLRQWSPGQVPAS